MLNFLHSVSVQALQEAVKDVRKDILSRELNVLNSKLLITTLELGQLITQALVALPLIVVQVQAQAPLHLIVAQALHPSIVDQAQHLSMVLQAQHPSMEALVLPLLMVLQVQVEVHLSMVVQHLVDKEVLVVEHRLMLDPNNHQIPTVFNMKTTYVFDALKDFTFNLVEDVFQLTLYARIMTTEVNVLVVSEDIQ